MKQNATIPERKNYLSHAFDQLDDNAQAQIETLTAQLAAVHKAASATGKKADNTVQPKQGKEE